jgi:hypothetical protein
MNIFLLDFMRLFHYDLNKSRKAQHTFVSAIALVFRGIILMLERMQLREVNFMMRYLSDSIEFSYTSDCQSFPLTLLVLKAISIRAVCLDQI